MITKEEFENIARLSGLMVAQKDYPRFSQNLMQMVEFADEIRQVPCDGFYEEHKGSVTSLRLDTVQPSADREEILKNAPCSQDGYFFTRKRA